MPQRIVVIVESHSGRIAPASLEAITCAARLQELSPAPILGITLGQDAWPTAQLLAAEHGLDALAVEAEGLVGYSAEAWLALLPELLGQLAARWVLMAATSQGQDLGPALAARLNAACIGGARGLEADEDGPLFVREVHGGKLLQRLRPLSASAVVLVQPGFFAPHLAGAGPAGQATRRRMAAVARRTADLPAAGQSQAGASLADAEVIVAAGRGLGKPENLSLMRDLAALFPRSAVAGSRPVCDDGWLEYRWQVGVTGQTVSPKLYIACGISGASQHVAGMRGAGLVVAINNDPQAAIFNEADVCVVEDVVQFTPALIASLRALKG